MSTAAVAVIASALLLGAPWAAAADDCPTWFPDLQCERQQRPEGTGLPMSMPYLFEDPYITSGLQLIGIWHDLPNSSVFRGGSAGVVALQARLAVTDWLAFIATRDGYTILRPNNPITLEEEGFMDITVGFKAMVYETEHFTFTPAVRFEIPVGNDEVFQGFGDGAIIISAAAAWDQNNWNVIGSLGGQLPFDRNANVSSLFYNLHVGHAFPVDGGFLRFISPFIELSGIHYTNSGAGTNTIDTALGEVTLTQAQSALMNRPFEGLDVANLGSKGVKGNDVVTMAFGVRLPLKGGLNFGLSYELPLSNRKDILEQRVTAMLAWEF